MKPGNYLKMLKKINQIEPIFFKNDKDSLKKYINSGSWFTEHKINKKFEKKFAKLVGSKFAVTFPNGTLTLLGILLASDLKKNDTVLVPSLTMVATANVVILSGLKLDFVDVSSKNLCVDPAALKKKIKKNKSIKMLIYVNFNGRTGDLTQVKKICKKNKILLVEDSAHSIGSYFKKKHHGTFGLASSFSFSMPKIITTGQGGIVVTSDKKFYEKLKKLKNFGRDRDGEDNYKSLGFNFKFTDLQASLGLSQLETLKFRIKRKKFIFNLYQKELSKLPNIKILKFSNYETPWFVDIFVDEKLALINYLKKHHIFCREIYPSLNKLAFFNNRSQCPISEQLSNKGIWLPSSVNLQKKDILRVTKLIKNFYDKNLFKKK